MIMDIYISILTYIQLIHTRILSAPSVQLGSLPTLAHTRKVTKKKCLEKIRHKTTNI